MLGHAAGADLEPPREVAGRRLGHEDAHDFSRAARDARLGPIGGGTDEIMKEILGKSFGL